MAKSEQKIQAIKLREGGESIKEIAKKIGVSKSSASIWCRDIVLNTGQIKALQARMVSRSYAGRMKGARMQYDGRIKRIADAEALAEKKIGKLSERDLLITLIGLYWGEGSKKNRQLSISNSDSGMIIFSIEAFKKIWGVENEDFLLRVGINEIHKKRDNEVRKYWSEITKIPLVQFRKTTFIKAKNKKIYQNFSVHYGTLTVRVRKSSNIYYQLMGFIKALNKAVIKRPG